MQNSDTPTVQNAPTTPGTANCPYLGFPSDPETNHRFPSVANHCLRLDDAKPVSFAHQSSHCLTSKYNQCPVYPRSFDGPFPRELLPEEVDAGWWPPSDRVWGLIAMVGLLIVGIAAIALVPSLRAAVIPGVGTPAPTAESSSAQGTASSFVILGPTSSPLPPTPTPTAAPTGTATPAPTASPTVTQTPQPSPTPFPTPGPGFETPFGPETQFIIHIVEAGESFTSISEAYDTTPEVLDAANVILEGASLWEGLEIVVPLGVTDPEAVPKFEIFFTTGAISVEELAITFETKPEQIRFYNQLGDAPTVPSGRWLIIPIQPPSP